MVITPFQPPRLNSPHAAARPKETSALEEPQDQADIQALASLGPGLAKTGLASGTSFAGRLSGPVGMIGTLGAIEVVNSAMGHSLNAFALHPRTLEGLGEIVTAPLLHANMSHFVNNAIGIGMVGGMIALQSPKKFAEVTALSALASGLGVWLTSPAPVVGASGVVYGYMGYAMTRGFFDRKPVSLAMAAASIALFAGSLTGMLPGVPGVSWQAHLFGFAGGVLAAKYLPHDDAPARKLPF